MPKRLDIKKILIIGAGPIVIGQACEFDYSGTQAVRALKAEGYEVVLVNSNPATIMTDPALADKTYIEPLTLETLTQIISQERPDAILPTMGGQTALNLTFQLHNAGILSQYNVETIGASFEAIEVAENRQAFKVIVEEAGLESLKSYPVETLKEAQEVITELGFPVIIRPAFTLGGSGGAVVFEPSEFEKAVLHGLEQSPISQILLEESALNWKEYEFEVMRDCADNVVIVCSVENVDPMGVHTGDSITVAPAQTLTDKEYQRLRNASIDIIRRVGVDAGGCNIQFAIHPKTGRTIVIEMNPRVSRSSALVSKATGVPIAKISAQLAIGKTLDEIANDITQSTPACFEPVIDYVVTKIPRFSFEKFPGSSQHLSPQMKSVGEVMAIGATFQESFQKALRGLEMKLDGFEFERIPQFSEAELNSHLKVPTPDRLRWTYEALHRGYSIQQLTELTGVDPWFLHNWQQLVEQEQLLSQQTLETITSEQLQKAKNKGFSDKQLAKLLTKLSKCTETEIREKRLATNITAHYKAVDTCAAEFDAVTPYFYGTYFGIESEIPTEVDNKKVIIWGGGPNRIGQGLEFDYCCVHAAQELKKRGYTAIMVNSNPETVSTDYDISDRLYFEPMTGEDIQNILEAEKPLGIIAQLGGQTPLGLAFNLHKQGVDLPLLGTTVASMDLAEDRDQFRKLLEHLNLLAPAAAMAITIDEAIVAAEKIGYPVIARPSYVLGGRAMRIFYSTESLKQYLNESIQVHPDSPVLIDKFLEEAVELDVDAVSDGDTIVIGGILEHIEHAGIHSGDSACVWPPQSTSEAMQQQVYQATEMLAKALGVRGLLNIQFAIKDSMLYVLEVNPRASRTLPFVCKATGVPMISLAIDVMLGKKLADLKVPERPKNHVAVKVPVFPFIKFHGADPLLGPEMKSTGEVMGIDSNFPNAFAKAELAAGMKLFNLNATIEKALFVSLNDYDKPRAVDLLKAYSQLGFKIYATLGTFKYLAEKGIESTPVLKKHEGSPNAEDLIRNSQIQLVINTPIGEEALTDDSYIRKSAIINNIPVITSLSAAWAIANALAGQEEYQYQPLQNLLKVSPLQVVL